MKLNDLNMIEDSIQGNSFIVFRRGTAFLFLIGIMVFMYLSEFNNTQALLLIISATIGGYMALNIGANDVADNIGPAVGSQALTLAGAIFIAMIFESAGFLIEGGHIVSTIKNGIINPALIGDTDNVVWLMMAALFAAAVWINLATYVNAPVSTVYSIVGGVLGAGIAAGGWQMADWNLMAAITASWVISPIIGGVIAAGLMYLIKQQITYKKDKLSAAKKMVPVLLMLMTGVFSSYLMVKGIKIEISTAFISGLVIAIVVYFLLRPLIECKASRLSNNKQSINQLFTLPLIVATALLSFAHGASDVASVVGPLAAIHESISNSVNAATVDSSNITSVPIWVMIVGTAGLTLGLVLYGPKLIRTVGSKITELDKMCAFCIALAASITVLIAIQFGLPVSSTHIAIGAIFGIGFLRESINVNYNKMMIEDTHQHKENDSMSKLLQQFQQAPVIEKTVALKLLNQASTQLNVSNDHQQYKNFSNNIWIKLTVLYRIAAAWIITVPATGILGAIIYFSIRGFILP
ncbi:MAG: inorganic phosphate transporter [Gammaproteobacteria bacterium]|jgi:PiT family inorganic phosphate transporter|nr:inorganic phosphate transporter [Gammaproteobacteria bacterium]MBT3722764.1 inorganic phosphate transporter [Gammaproteobacteria bacterium]MBT4195390.1 inorganic phosphate transporter [Gammaproteobacteria bacterium]MBT4448100.1 inorganic phosphate transporter [Gammaproteobacteria bacterium]MBT4860416.1 inorganic phosphate transporter [Gammaproteobacteria bacterium]